MAFRVEISPRAFNDLDEIARYIKGQGSFEQAEEWFNGIIAAIRTLEEMPHRCPVADVSKELGQEGSPLVVRKAQPQIQGVLFDSTEKALDRDGPGVSCEALGTEELEHRPTPGIDGRPDRIKPTPHRQEPSSNKT
jgi:plasmid stabilization system protein ParE